MTRTDISREEFDEIKRRLEEAEETIRCIREGEVDAIVVSGSKGDQVFALAGSDQIYRRIVETMREAALTTTLEGKILFCNRQFAELVERPMQNILGRSLHELVPPEGIPGVESLLLDSGRNPVRQRLLLAGGTGKTVPVHISANVLHQPDGDSICIVATDLTELENSTEMLQRLRRHQQALAESESRLRAIFEASKDAIVIVDDERRFVDANKAAERIFGLPLEQLLAKKVSDYEIPGPEIDRFIEEIREKGRFQSELRLRLPDRSIIHVDVYSVANILPGKHLSVVRDITESKCAEEALRESEERFHTLADNMSQLAWIADADGWVFWYNKRWFDFTGTTQEEMEGWGWQKVHHPDHLPRVIDKISASVQTGEAWEDTFPLRSKDGAYLWFLARAIPIHNAEGKVVRWFGTSTDITELRQVQESLRQSAAELARSNKDLEQFAYVASHDLQEPLRMVSGFLRLLSERSQNLSEKDREYIEYAVDGANRMQRMIIDLLAYSRAGGRNVERRPVDLNDVLESVKNNLSSAIQQADAAITSEGLPTVIADPNQMIQVFQNLLGNALKFRRSDQQPEIRLSAVKQPGCWLLRIRDNGIGIDPQQAERVFALFQRLHTRDKYEGSGIGLAICKKIIERNGGCIGVESEPGAGATFWFTLPA